MKYVLVFVIGVLVATGACTWWENRKAAQAELAYTTAVNNAQNAKEAAEKRAENLDTKRLEALASATEKYDQGRLDEKAQSNRVIADLLADATRLRVRTNRDPAGSCGVPTAPAAAGSGDGEATETLAGPVAARLAGRYADYNAAIEQLSLCQQVIEADRLQ